MKDYKCQHCKDTGWIEAIGPCSDGSYITSRPCYPDCEARREWIREDRDAARIKSGATAMKNDNVELSDYLDTDGIA